MQEGVRAINNLAQNIALFVVGPTSATDNAVARFNGSGGNSLQNSNVIIDDSGNVTGVQSLTTNILQTSIPVTKTGTSGSQGANDTSLIINASGTYTLTLLSAVSFPGRWLYVKTIANQAVNSASSNVVPVATAVAGTAIVTNTAGKYAVLQSDGANWITMVSN